MIIQVILIQAKPICLWLVATQYKYISCILEKETSLCVAARENRVEVVEFLLSKNADINYLSREQATPLCIASSWGKKYLEWLFFCGSLVRYPFPYLIASSSLEIIMK